MQESKVILLFTVRFKNICFEVKNAQASQVGENIKTSISQVFFSEGMTCQNSRSLAPSHGVSFACVPTSIFDYL